MGIGGKVQKIYVPQSCEDLIEAVDQITVQHQPFFVLAGGSNTVFADEELRYDQSVILLTHLSQLRLIEPGVVCCDAGASLQELVDYSKDQNYSGAIGLNRVPGTVGGAVVGNAGAYGDEIGQVVAKVDCIDLEAAQEGRLKIVTLTHDECEFGYRTSKLKKRSDLLVYQVFMQFDSTQDQQEDERRYWEIATKRDSVYPQGLKSPGSTFKNLKYSELSTYAKSQIPEGWVVYGDKLPAGRLLEEIGAKGYQVGGVKMRDTHANIMINEDGGTYSDVVNLVAQLQDKVKQRFNVFLEPEIRIVPPDFKNFTH